MSQFLYIGRLSEEKGIQCLLDAFKTSPFALNIGGNGPLRNSVIDICEQCPNINYLGNLSKEQVIREMQASTALIFPSVWYEGMPLTIIEAFSSGLPVIASNLGAMSSMIRDGYSGLLFEVGNTQPLQEQLQIWSNKTDAEKKQFSQNAYQAYLDNYTPEKNIKQLENIYNSAICHKSIST